MKYLTGIAILASLMLGASAQLLLRKGMLVMAAQSPATNVVALISSVVTNSWLWIGLFCYAASMGPWLFVLSRPPVSIAYPGRSARRGAARGAGRVRLVRCVLPGRPEEGVGAFAEGVAGWASQSADEAIESMPD
jgi:hypothetical protein